MKELPISSKKVSRWYWRGKGFASKRSVCRYVAKKEVAIYCATVVMDSENRYQANRNPSSKTKISTVKEAYDWLFVAVLGEGVGHYLEKQGSYQTFISRRARELAEGTKTILREGWNYDRFENEWPELYINKEDLRVFPWHDQFMSTCELSVDPEARPDLNLLVKVKPQGDEYDPFADDGSGEIEGVA